MQIYYTGIGCNKTGQHTENEFLNREFTHKSWGYELSIIPRESHHQLQFKDWIEYSGAEIGV